MVFIHHNFGRMLYMSVNVMLYFSLNASVNDIYPELSDQNGYPYIGQVTIMVSCLMEMFGSIYGAKLVSLKKSGLGLFVSGLFPIVIFIPALIINHCTDAVHAGICSYHSVAIFSVAGFAMQGLGLGVFTLLFNCYQSASTNIQASELLQGMSFTIIGMDFLLGNAYSLPLIKKLGRQKYFFALAVTQFVVNILFLFLPNPIMELEVNDQTPQLSGKEETEMVAVGQQANKNNDSVNSEIDMEYNTNPEMNKDGANSDQQTQATHHVKPVQVAGADNASDEVHNSDISKEEQEVLAYAEEDPLRAIMWYMRQPSVQTLLPYFLMTGLIIGFQFGQFYEFIAKCLPSTLTQLEIDEKIFAVFIYFGFGEILSGPFIAIVGDRIDLSYYLRAYTLMAGVTIVVTIINFFVKSYQTCCFIALAWGLVDNFGVTTANMIITQQWGDNFSVFGIYLTFCNIGIIAYQIFAIFFIKGKMITGLGFMVVCQIACVICTHIFIKRHYKKRDDKEE